MNKSSVYMVNTEEMDIDDSLIDRLVHLWNQVDVKDWIKKDEIVVIKTHFGSRNQTRHLRPMYIQKIVELVRAAGGIPWVAEGVGLGWDEKNKEFAMANGPGYTNLANQHGFNHGSMNAPIIMDDGVIGTEVFRVHNENGKHIKDIAMAMGLRIADKVLIVSRFKGHDGAGFGGALKQLGIGCVGKEGKGVAHWGGGDNIYVKNPENCDGCGDCLRICPYECLSLDENNKIVLDNDRCVACAMCFGKCHTNKSEKERVFALKRQVPRVEQAERMMDNAAGVVKGIGNDRIRYLNIAVDITAHCDCASVGEHLLVPDQGILYSKDPVAIDQAGVDLVTESPGMPMSPAETGKNSPHGRIEPNSEAMKPGGQKFGLFSRWAKPEERATLVDAFFSAAVTQGLGSREYELIDVTPKKAEK